MTTDLAVFIGQVDLHQLGTTIDVDQLAADPNYDPRHTANDVGLVHLSTPIPVAVYAPIALIAGGDIAHDAPGTPVSVAGWGATKAKSPYDYPSVMQQADIQILRDPVCGRQRAYGNGFRPLSMLCAEAASNRSKMPATATAAGRCSRRRRPDCLKSASSVLALVARTCAIRASTRA